MLLCGWSSNATRFCSWSGHQFLAGTWSCSRNNCHLFLSSTLAQVGGQHYVLRSWHKKAIAKNCLAVDGLVNPNLDIVVNVAPIGKCMCRKSLVRIRYILLPTTQDSLCEGKSKQPFLVEDLCIITLHNMVRKLNCKGTARANGGDFGDMHAMGTHVPCWRQGPSTSWICHKLKGSMEILLPVCKLNGKDRCNLVPWCPCYNTRYGSRHRSQSCVINGQDGKYATCWLVHNWYYGWLG